MTTYGSIRLERIEDALRVIHNPRNDLNTVDEELHAELGHLFAELKREDGAPAVVLTGHGRAFSAGGDFDWLARMPPDRLVVIGGSA